jgi:hypothetical protein
MREARRDRTPPSAGALLVKSRGFLLTIISIIVNFKSRQPATRRAQVADSVYPNGFLEGGITMERLKYLRPCAWTGPVFLMVFIVFWGLFSNNIPPIAADTSAALVADFFRDSANMVRLGMTMAMSFVVFYFIWGLAIAKVIELGIERENNVMSTLALWGAGLTVVPILVSCSFWLTGSYRPEALDDSILQMLYDMAWLLIDLGYMVTTVQMCAIGIGFLSDEREVPLVPKWFAWYGIWVGFSFIAEVFMPFFTSGIFARHGMLNFWIEFFLWFFWIVGMTYYTLGAISRLEAEARGETVSAGARGTPGMAGASA